MNSEISIKRKAEWRSYILGFGVFMIYWAGDFWLNNRCDFIACEPASWDKIQEIVIDNTTTWNNKHYLENNPIFIYKVNDNKLGISEFLEDIEIYVRYVTPLENSSEERSIYSTRTIQFDDKNLWITSSDGSEGSALNLPSEDILAKFEQVQVGYREVIEKTWAYAQTVANSHFEIVTVELFLMNDFNQDFEHTTFWEVTYYYQGENIWYWVDAHSGKIIKSGSK